MAEVAEVMTFEEAEARYAGKWLALEVVSEGEGGMPREVRVLEQADTRGEVCEKTRSLHDILIAYAGPVAPEGWEFLFVAGGLSC